MSLLSVTVKKAQYCGIPAQQLNTYVTLKLQNVKSTTITVKGANPCWEQDFLFEINDLNTGLLIEVWSKGLLWDRALGYHYMALEKVFYSNQDFPEKWISLDSELEIRGNDVIGTKCSTGHKLLIDYCFETPFDLENDKATDLQHKLEILNNTTEEGTQLEQVRRQMLYSTGHFLDSRIHIFSRRTLGRNLNEIYKEVKLKIKASLESVQYLSSTADIWSTKHRSFLGVTSHYIDENSFERRSVVLACRRFQGSHTFDQIAIKLNTVYDEYDLSYQKIVSTVTDNATNFVKAFEEFGLQSCYEDDQSAETPNLMENRENLDSLLETDCHSSVDSDDSDSEDDLDDTIHHFIDEVENEVVNITLPKHLRCATHTLNLVSTTDFIKYIAKSDVKDMHDKVMAKCRKLWKWAKRHKSSEIIKQCLKCNLKYPTVVRWNSFHDALGDLVKYKSKLNILLKALKANFQFTEDEIAYLEELHMLMKPIAEALDHLQEDNCYYGELIAVLCTLRRDLYSFFAGGHLSYFTPLVPHLLQYLNKRFEKIFSMEAYNAEALAAATLIPAYKLGWIPEDYDDSVVQNVKKNRS